MKVAPLGRAMLAALALGLAPGFAQSTNADAIPYPDGGLYNTTAYTFTAASGGDVIAYIVGGFGAGYSNELGLLINGAPSGAGFGLGNHSSSLGDSFHLGTAAAGDTLTFILHNLSLGMDAYSDPSLNAPYDAPGVAGHNHIYSTDYTATSPVFPGVPAGTYVAFEDLPFPNSDFNYDDESFVFTNVLIGPPPGSVPEPGTLGLLAGALVPLSALALRRRRMNC